MARQLDLLGDVVPDDRAIQVDGNYYVKLVGASVPTGGHVLDVGCGTGRSERVVRSLDRELVWTGVDIVSSPAVDRRKPGSKRRLVAFDGIELPFADSAFDLIYSNQVLEHVRHPEHLLREIRRVLKPGAAFVGGTSNLEPYHALSYWNFTPFGFKTIVQDAGLQLVEMRPGIDGPTLIERQVRGRPDELNRFFTETSPLNERIIGSKRHRRGAIRQKNDRMLQFCGHFGFHVVRPNIEEST
ncbi:MAG: class I SAM-dependent methyltransferase [Ilumatobacteraceae bacterium]|nr:class I SAM-dependent methyltransferase [Ilumatobacteraceae bacterium]